MSTSDLIFGLVMLIIDLALVAVIFVQDKDRIMRRHPANRLVARWVAALPNRRHREARGEPRS